MSVDLSNLREMTGGDASLEQELFTEYLRSAEEFITTLASSLEDAQRDQWRTTAHAFKGTSLILGANDLGQLCKKAQDDFEKSSAEKQALLTQISAAFTDVKAFLATA